MNSKVPTASTYLFTTLVIGTLAVSLFSILVFAVPEGVVISQYGNSTKALTPATGAAHNKGAIHYLLLSTIQQNNRWKAYVGNVSGTLVLQDSSGFNIYDWALTSTFTGSVIASRNSSLNWAGTMNCTSQTIIGEMQDSLQFTHGTSDNINATFAASNHSTMTVNSQSFNGCHTVYTFQNSTRQGANSSANVFQEIMIMDNFTSVAFVTPIAADISAYKNGSTADFQLLLPDIGNISNTGISTYYFFVELT